MKKNHKVVIKLTLVKYFQSQMAWFETSFGGNFDTALVGKVWTNKILKSQISPEDFENTYFTM